MTAENFPLNRKETFSASLVIFIGMFYLLSLASGFFHAPQNQMILMKEFKLLFSGVLYVSGGIAMFRKKHAGWVVSAATLFYYMIMVFQIVFNITREGDLSRYAIIPSGLLALIIIAFIFLLSKQTRLDFRVNNKSYLLAIALVAVLAVFIYLM